ncbi:hypothetical protein FHG87_021970 [Trinorchestia longiramus]|nr:hypothetical protein FHG87_021970 [Trinorchestia longiramus]
MPTCWGAMTNTCQPGATASPGLAEFTLQGRGVLVCLASTLYQGMLDARHGHAVRQALITARSVERAALHSASPPHLRAPSALLRITASLLYQTLLVPHNTSPLSPLLSPSSPVTSVLRPLFLTIGATARNVVHFLRSRPGVGKVVDIDPWGSKTKLKGSEGGRLRIYMVEAGFSHANAILTKQRNRLNLENRGDLRLKLNNFKPNINSLAAAHQAHPSH